MKVHDLKSRRSVVAPTVSLTALDPKASAPRSTVGLASPVSSATGSSAWSGLRLLLASIAAPTAAFAMVQTILAGINLGLTSVPMMFDVTTTYQAWADQWFQHSIVVGVDTP